jgi:hypothetical protein
MLCWLRESEAATWPDESTRKHLIDRGWRRATRSCWQLQPLTPAKSSSNQDLGCPKLAGMCESNLCLRQPSPTRCSSGARNQGGKGAVRWRQEEIRARLHEPCTEVVKASDTSIWSLVRPTLVTLPFCLQLSSPVYLDVFVSSCVSCGLFYTLFRMAVSRVKLIQCCSETWKLELIEKTPWQQKWAVLDWKNVVQYAIIQLEW